MPLTPQTPTIDRAPAATTDAVHLTRRARIEAERAATARGRGRVQRSSAPVTPPAPSSPVLPASAVGPQTPPAPSSPVVAPLRPGAARAAAPDAVTPAAATPPASATAAGARAGRGTRTATPARAPRAAGTRPARRAPAPKVDRATRHIARTAPAASTSSGSSFRRTASRVTVVGSLLFAAGLVVSTSLPAQALYVPETGTATVRSAEQGAVQSLSVGDAVAGPIDRDAYTVSAAAKAPTAPTATTEGASVSGSSGDIRWPFPTTVPISSGFGARQVAGCSFCSTFHQGVDFAPGRGTPIHVVAAGTVIKVQADDGGFGNDVWVQHDVDGKQFVSVYGHMEDNSFMVTQGQQVAAGDELGLVGSTGNSTGPHLHLEIHLNGIPVDPLAWLTANVD